MCSQRCDHSSEISEIWRPIRSIVKRRDMNTALCCWSCGEFVWNLQMEIFLTLKIYFSISFMWIPVKSKKPSSALATALQSPFRLLSAVVTLCPTWDTFFSLFCYLIYSSVGPWYYLQYREASRFWWSVDLHLLWLFSLSQIKYRL